MPGVGGKAGADASPPSSDPYPSPDRISYSPATLGPFQEPTPSLSLRGSVGIPPLERSAHSERANPSGCVAASP